MTPRLLCSLLSAAALSGCSFLPGTLGPQDSPTVLAADESSQLVVMGFTFDTINIFDDGNTANWDAGQSGANTVCRMWGYLDAVQVGPIEREGYLSGKIFRKYYCQKGLRDPDISLPLKEIPSVQQPTEATDHRLINDLERQNNAESPSLLKQAPQSQTKKPLPRKALPL